MRDVERIYARAFGPRLSPEEAAALGRVLEFADCLAANSPRRTADLATLAPLLEGGKP